MIRNLFATMLVTLLVIGLSICIYQDSDAGSPSVSASASCGSNSASASVTPYISGEYIEGESFSGSGSCEAQAGWNSDDDDGPISVKVVRKRIWFISWLTTESTERSAGVICNVGRPPGQAVSTSASASGSIGGASDSDSCSGSGSGSSTSS